MKTRLQDKLEDRNYQVCCLLSPHGTRWWKIVNEGTDGREPGHDVCAVSDIFTGGKEGYATLREALTVLTFKDVEDNEEIEIELDEHRWYEAHANGRDA